MRLTSIAGILLIVFGVIALAYPRFSYKDRDTVVDLGPVEITTEDTDAISIPPILGALALAGGAGLMVAGLRRSTKGG